MDNKDITAVITSFKSETKILNCIKSLGKDFKIIIIENSYDKKLKNKLEKEYPNIKCVLSDKNLGYAKGNNLGLEMVKTKYDLGTLAAKINDKKFFDNDNIVKVITEESLENSQFPRALNFMRKLDKENNHAYHHLGIHCYNVEILKKVELKQIVITFLI